MVSNIIFLYIHLRLCEIFNTNNSNYPYFGKINIILFRDLLQLPPVKEDFVFVKVSQDQIEKYVGGSGSCDLWDLFEYDELTINMRQKNDKEYSELLSRVRLGFVTNNDIKLLNDRKLSFSSNDREVIVQELCSHSEKLPDDTVFLLPMCKILNKAMLDRMAGEGIHLIAQDSFNCSKNLAKKVNTLLAKDSNEQQCGIERVITIKIGARIRIIRNIDVSVGLVNGALAKVIAILKDVNGQIEEVRIRLNVTKQEHNLERLDFKFIVMDTVCIIRKQFPFRLS